MSNEELEHGIADVAAEIAAATCRWLLLVAEFDRRGGHEAWGFHDCSGWLAWRCSVAPRSAREHLRVARCLGDLPSVREAFSRGELSYSKVRAITRVASPEQEAELVELARHASAAQLERLVRAYSRALRVEDAERAHERRYLAYSWEREGSLSIQGSLSAEDGALLLRALEAGREEVREVAADGGSAEPPRRACNADALVLMAETLLAAGPAARNAGERSQVVVHVDAEALSGATVDGRRCELEDGAPLCPETARRLSCDASRLEILDGSDGPLDVGRRTRTVPPAMRRALRSRDGGCRFPGCANERWTDAHHIRHWAQGGDTAAHNLVELCRRHHRLVHEGGFKVDRSADGDLRFTRPDGALIPNAPAAPGCAGGRQRNRLPGLPGRPVPPPPAGGRMDLDLAVTALLTTEPRSARGP